MIINEHVGSPIKSDNVHFANNEQASLVFFIAHAKQNLIKLKLYSNQSIQAVNNISESGMWNSIKPMQFPYLWKLANQSMLNKAHEIEITKACISYLYESKRIPLCSIKWETCQLEKKQDGENDFFKASS